MSNKYPCIYYDNGKCQKFSDDTYNAWCSFSDCDSRTPSIGDYIRSLDDRDLAGVLCSVYDEDDGSKFIYGYTIPDYDEDAVLDWLKQPYKEDA